MGSQKYLVTGGAGFIGSHVVDLLISEGHEVRILDNLTTGQTQNINPKADFVELDIFESKDLAKVIKGFDGIFHLAALSRIQSSFIDPASHDDINVRATILLLGSMDEAKVPAMVYSGSSSAYGNATEIPTTEAAAINPLSPYALQKYASEQYAIILGKARGIRVNVLRYFNVFGPRSFNPNSPDNAYSSVIGIFGHAQANNLPIKVTGDGEQRRDFVHAFDVAQANYRLMQSDLSYETLNVGQSRSYSINEVAKMFADTWEFIPERPGEAIVTHANIDRMKKLLDWAPEVTLEEAIANGWI